MCRKGINIFDDLEDKKIAPEINETVKEKVIDNSAIRRRLGRISKSTRSKDFVSFEEKK